MSEEACSALLSILANVLKGLKLPALAESSSISAWDSELGSLGWGHHQEVAAPAYHQKWHHYVFRPKAWTLSGVSRAEENVSCQRKASIVLSSSTKMVPGLPSFTVMRYSTSVALIYPCKMLQGWIGMVQTHYWWQSMQHGCRCTLWTSML